MINVLKNYAASMPDNYTYLEIGCNEGRSLKEVILTKPPGKVIICDKWGWEAGGLSRGSHDHISKLLNDIEYKNEVVFLDGDSHELLGKETIIPKESVNLLLVDGDHTFEGAELDLNNCWPLVKKGGIMIFDDIYHPQHLYLLELANKFSEQINRPFDVISEEGHGVCAWRK